MFKNPRFTIQWVSDFLTVWLIFIDNPSVTLPCDSSLCTGNVINLRNLVLPSPVAAGLRARPKPICTLPQSRYARQLPRWGSGKHNFVGCGFPDAPHFLFVIRFLHNFFAPFWYSFLSFLKLITLLCTREPYLKSHLCKGNIGLPLPRWGSGKAQLRRGCCPQHPDI